MSRIRHPGVIDLEIYLKSNTEDVRRIFERECSLMLECRVCKNIYRDFADFYLHKRRFCTGEAHDSVDCNVEKGSTIPPKKGTALRRTNLIKQLYRKVEVTEVPISTEHGQSTTFMHTLPSARRRVVAVVRPDGSTQVHIPATENVTGTLPPDRVLLLQPQTYPVRYHGMNLRMRSKSHVTRIISNEEVEVVERLLTYFDNLVEPALCRCLYSSCSDISPFGSIWALAYHMSVKHSRKEERTNAIPCMMCSKKFVTWDYFYAHLINKHEQIKLDHLAQRRKEAEEIANKKKTKKAKTRQGTSNGAVRCRSLSPEPNRDLGDQKTCGVDERRDAKGVNIPAIMKDEAENLDVRVTAVSTDNVECNILTLNEASLSCKHAVHEQIECKRVRPPLTGSEGSGQQRVASSRERRKRKVPQRYRDDDLSVVKDEVVKAREQSETPCSVQEGNPVAVTAATICENSAVKDVTAVVRFLVSSVEQSCRELSKSASDAVCTNVRSRSSRLRKRPEWMDKEDFVIVDDHKYRRDGIADASILPIVGQGVSTSSNTVACKNDVEPLSAGQCSSSNAAHRNAVVSPQSPQTTPNSTETLRSSSSRRKQNLSAISDDTDDSVIILSKNGKPGKVTDLSMVPVYLSGAQRQLFFSSLKQFDPNEPDGKHVCSQCNEVVPNLKEGRRHMVTHIRVIRLRCSLCGAGSFFCTDLRVHLMEGHCEKLHRAPEGVVNSNRTPCMTKEQADALSEVVDSVNPGRAMYTSGKIVSAKSRIPYYPDPVIEERILGRGRNFRRSSPALVKGGNVRV